MRRFSASVFVVLVGTIVATNLVQNPGSRVHAADQQLSRTEAELGRAVRETHEATRQVAAAITEGRTPDMMAFDHSTARMQRLVAQLELDMKQFSAMRDRTVRLIEQELGSLQDAQARQGLEILRDDALRSSEERLRAADLVLVELRAALARAADVTHATKALALAQSLRSHEETVARHVDEARSVLLQYRE